MHRGPVTAVVLSLAALGAIPAVAGASGVAYPDADWSQAWIQSSDGVTLHADVLRPKGSTNATKTPVIVSIGPYFNHSGQTGPVGPAEGTNYDPVGPNAGPSERFQDFVEGSGLLQKGYSFVMVDLRGFGDTFSARGASINAALDIAPQFLRHLTPVARVLAERLGGEVVSADSAALYAGIPVLTAAPEYPARLVGVVPLEDEVSVGEYTRLAHAAIDEILAAGGTSTAAAGFASAGGVATPVAQRPKVNSQYENVGRNELCPCGSGKKFKKCHGA